MSSRRRRLELSIDVVEEILVQSRAKDLIRHKAVCRAWFDLISSQRFIKKHLLLHQSSKKKIIAAAAAAPTANITHEAVVPLSLPDGQDDEPPQVYLPPPWWAQPPSQNVVIVGSCNGILCLVSDSHRKLVCLWNPSTREYLMAPYISGLYDASVFALGFGYDATTDDYKVVMITYTMKYEYYFEVWSRSTRIWRAIADSSVLFKLIMHAAGGGYNTDHQAGIFLRGKLYWLAYGRLPNPNAMLISFDMGEETFRTIEILADTIGRRIGGAVFDFMGSIALAISRDFSRVYSIMVLGDDYKNWTCKFTIGPFMSAGACLERVCIDRKFVLRVEKKYFLYNPLTGEEKEFLGAEAPPRSCYGIGNMSWSFVESLVSVKSEPLVRLLH